jgi:hypothetical protein
MPRSTFTVSASTTEVSRNTGVQIRPVSAAVLMSSRLRFTAAASKASPSENVTPERRSMVHES